MSQRRSVAHRLGRVLESVTRQSGRLSTTPDYGSWLLGKETESQARRRVRIQMILTVFILFTNLLGIIVATTLVAFAFPVPSVFSDAPGWLTFGVAPAYIAVALGLGTFWVTRRIVSSLRWAIEERPPNRTDHRNTFVAPWRVRPDGPGSVGFRHCLTDRAVRNARHRLHPAILVRGRLSRCPGGHRLLHDHRIRASSGRGAGLGSRSASTPTDRWNHGPDHAGLAARLRGFRFWASPRRLSSRCRSRT